MKEGKESGKMVEGEKAHAAIKETQVRDGVGQERNKSKKEAKRAGKFECTIRMRMNNLRRHS